MLIEDLSRLVVMDLGLAKILDATSLTRTDAGMIGTLCYMAPEQLRHGRNQLDHRVDVDGLGVSLYEIATGKPFLSEEQRCLGLHEGVRRDGSGDPRAVSHAVPRSKARRHGMVGALVRERRHGPSDPDRTADPGRLWLRHRPPPVQRSGRAHPGALLRDPKGWLIRIDSRGLDGNTIISREGCAFEIREYNDWGRVKAHRYFGPQGERILTRKGYATVRIRFDELGREIERLYYGLDDEPILAADGSAGVRLVFEDEFLSSREVRLGLDHGPLEAAQSPQSGS